MTANDVQVENPALRLARYLKKFVGLRTTTVRDVTKYESVLWFGDMPQEPDCRSAAWTDDYDADDPWLEVKKQQFEKTPAPPVSTLPWVDEQALKRATQDIAALRPTIFLPDDEAELEEGETPPLSEHSLNDHPEVQQAYDRYRSRWEAWSTEHRRREAIQRVYAELFRLHTQVRKQGEIIEVVLGLGLLDWRAKLNERVIPIRRHAVVGRVEVEFDPAKGAIRVLPPGDGARLRIEDDMLEAELRPDRTHYAAAEMQLEEIGDDIWDKGQMHTALRAWVGALSPDSQWSDGLGATASVANDPTMSFAPALILRKRTQTGMVRIYNELIGQLSNDAIEIPELWKGLIDDVGDCASDGDRGRDEQGRDRALKDPAKVYFPLAANREQRRIVEAIDRQRGVLVQGPPGTGKSHTIANLMCHLLATGKRVLITAETGRALQVLKDKLPREIQPLCVSLLGQGGDAFAELNTSVQGITTRQAAYSPRAYGDRIAEMDLDLDNARRRFADTESELRSLREEETCSHSVAHGTYNGTASAIAEQVARESEQYSWLQLPRDAKESPPLSNEDVMSWLKIRQRYTDEQVADANAQIPLSSELPAPADFASAVTAEAAASLAIDNQKDLRSYAAYAPIQALTHDSREQLRTKLKRLEDQRLVLDRVEGEWRETALQDLVSGRRARWDTVLDVSRDRLPRIERLIEGVGDRTVALPDAYDPRRVRADAAAARSYFKGGGKWKRFGIVTPRELKGRAYLKDEVLVDGEGAADTDRLQVVSDYLEFRFELADLQSVWNGVGATPSPEGDRRLSLAVLSEQASVLEQCREYADGCHLLAQSMAGATSPIPDPDWLGGQAQEYLDLIDAASVEDRFKDASRTVDSCVQELASLRGLHDAHPVVQALADAIEARDVYAYSQSHSLVVSTEATRMDQQRRMHVEDVLADAAPGLVDSVASSLGDEAWETRIQAWHEAWRWSLADAWLEKRSDFEYQRELWARRYEVEKEIGSLLAEAAALRAWTHFFGRLSPREAAALKSWREAVRAMGKGTGKSAKLARLRQEARRYMDACRDAIPVWIMPRYLVAEMVDPAPGRYDLVIVDEASQLGVESLFLFYIAKKLVVVGDDQQISPYGVGVADTAIAGLQQHYLDGIPHHHALSAQSSLYGNAKIRFSQNIVLREHFRCMPEIIQFSNDLCYASNGTPLDPLRAYPANRLQPLILRHVAEGYRVGGTQNAQNPPEADAIVVQIAACVEDPRYAGATMGVISLQGEGQAKLIERRLLETLDPEVIEERRLICGDAYAFQGDERNVIFLSMVAAPGERRIGALTAESARQRFNVAVSRAQDQLWLYHTASLDVLSDTCMRYRLLSYMLDPARQTTAEGEQRFDSKFERDVYRRLTERGFHVQTQVCVGDPTNHRYRIDLVVEGMQGRLAVECDGDEWHGAERYEHDMARQRDLERAGWQFARIRGGDFYRDPARAMEPVWGDLDRLGIQPGGIDKAAAEPPSPASLETIGGREEIFIEPEASEPPPAGMDPEPPVASSANSALPGAHQPTSGAPAPGPSVLVPDEELQPFILSPVLEPRLFPQPPPTIGIPGTRESYISFEGESGPDPRHANPARVAEVLRRIIDVEGPMLAKRSYDIYLRGCGIHRMGDPLKRAMNRALQHAIRKGHIAMEDESGKGGLVYSIVRSASALPVLVRDRGPRDFEEIPPSELQLVARRLAESEGLEPGSDAHLRVVLDFFDLKRLTVHVGITLLDILGRRYSYVNEIIGGGE